MNLPLLNLYVCPEFGTFALPLRAVADVEPLSQLSTTQPAQTSVILTQEHGGQLPSSICYLSYWPIFPSFHELIDV